MRRGALLAILVAAIACSPGAPEPDADGTWVGTITTEGNVTTVVNESGSVWGGAARLVEEASIGVESGEDPYMFGRIAGVVARGQRIYVLDGQVPALRMYDFDGRHIADIGGVGSGPGEFREPDALGTADDGRLFVRDDSQGRVLVYAGDGRVIDTWRPQLNIRTNVYIAVTRAGGYYAPVVIERANDVLDWKWGMQQYGPDGPVGEPVPLPDFPLDQAQLEAHSGRSMMAMDIPFYPALHWVLAPTGAMVAGTSDDYSFEIHEPTGRVIRVSKDWDPLPVPADATDHLRRYITRRMREMDPAWSWDGPDIPASKPAFSQLVPDRDGRIWIQSIVGTRSAEDCDPEERGQFCWPDLTAVDAFGADGHYLGRLEYPPGFGLDPQTFISGDVVIDVAIDDAGTVMVKRYRLVLPGAQAR